MSALERLVRGGLTIYEGALSCAVAILSQDNELSDLERRLIGLFRDQFSPLSDLDEATFQTALERGIRFVSENNLTNSANIPAYVHTHLAPIITQPNHRAELYRYAYALAMADLAVDEGEQVVLSALVNVFNLAPSVQQAAEADVLREFYVLHHAIAATALGLIVVTADGQVQQDELDHIREARGLLAPIGRLDDLQFSLVYDMALNIHDRFLLDPENREEFLNNIVANVLNTHELGLQAFEYAAAVATADTDISSAELRLLEKLMETLKINDAQGLAIFARYKARVKTVDGEPHE
ncbi:MAG: TerB family tellurite resistance protein [Anaerolineae bacterium]|nr:TerB family tellurite resistance protein [Anaerolineae bacterium]MDW8300079.1 TerB family tellurite resistance protein [Anaerolineae bacterium]